MAAASGYVATGHSCEVTAGTNLAETETLTAAPVRETSTLTLGFSAVGNINGEYIVAGDENGTVGFWFDVDDDGTSAPTTGATRDVEITTLATDDTTAQAATKIALAINADRSFVAYASGSVVTIESLLTGTRTAISTDIAGADGTVAVATAGANLTATIGVRWEAACDATSRYRIFGGWAGRYASVSGYTNMHVASQHAGDERVALVVTNAYDATGAVSSDELHLSTRLSSSARIETSLETSHVRLKVVGLGTAATGAIQTQFHTAAGNVSGSLGQDLEPGYAANTSRSVLIARNHGRYHEIQADAEHGLHVSIANPTTSFGEVITASPTHILQMKFTYQLHSQLVTSELSPPLRLDLTTPGDGSTAQVITVYLPAKNVLSTGQYVILYDGQGTPASYGVWFDLTGADGAPTIYLPGTTPTK